MWVNKDLIGGEDEKKGDIFGIWGNYFFDVIIGGNVNSDGS
jgi:hypothetical protein